MDEAAFAQLEAGITGELVLLTVSGAVLAGVQGDAAAVVAALEHDVDHAGNGVGAVLRRGTVAQHFNAQDRGDRDRVQVHRRRAPALTAVEIDKCGGVPALAVDQDQHLVGSQAAQLCRAHRIGTIGNGRTREIKRGQRTRQGGSQFHGTGSFQRFRRDHIDRRGRFGDGAGADTGAGDHHGVECAWLPGLDGCRCLGECRHRGKRGQQGECKR